MFKFLKEKNIFTYIFGLLFITVFKNKIKKLDILTLYGQMGHEITFHLMRFVGSTNNPIIFY